MDSSSAMPEAIPLEASSSSDLANSSETEICVEYLKHHWTVKNFSHCYQEYLENFVHLQRGDEKLVWSIKIYPKGNGENNKDFVFLCLNRICYPPSKGPKIGFRSRFQLKNSEGKDIEMRVHPNPSHSDYVSYIKRDVLFPQIHPDDSITVFVEIDVAVQTVTINAGELLPAAPNSGHILSKDFEALLDDTQHSDFIVRTQNKDFHVHKAVLAARSSYFSAMLSHKNTEESQNGIVNISDFDERVVQEMIKYIYSASFPSDTDYATELLIAADKYSLDDLKVHCERKLIRSLGCDNACEYLILGDVYGAKNLKESAIRFIQRFPKDITSTKGWDELVRDHHAIVTEIVRSFNKATTSSIGPHKSSGSSDGMSLTSGLGGGVGLNLQAAAGANTSTTSNSLPHV